jgi:glycosyltransferase involved in cell wall biosynthesis
MESDKITEILSKQNNPLLVNFDSITAPVCYRNKIVTLHDIIWVRYPQSFSRGFAFYTTYLIIVLRNSLAIITVSNFSKKEIINYFKNFHKAPHVIYNAVDEKFQIGNERGHISKPYGRFVAGIS